MYGCALIASHSYTLSNDLFTHRGTSALHSGLQRLLEYADRIGEPQDIDGTAMEVRDLLSGTARHLYSLVRRLAWNVKRTDILDTAVCRHSRCREPGQLSPYAVSVPDARMLFLWLE